MVINYNDFKEELFKALFKKNFILESGCPVFVIVENIDLDLSFKLLKLILILILFLYMKKNN